MSRRGSTMVLSLLIAPWAAAGALNAAFGAAFRAALGPTLWERFLEALPFLAVEGAFLALGGALGAGMGACSMVGLMAALRAALDS